MKLKRKDDLKITSYPHFYQLSEKDKLSYAINNGNIVDIAALEEQYEMDRTNQIVSDSKIKIYQGKDGNYYARIPDINGKNILRKRSTLQKINSLIVSAIDTNKPVTVREMFDLWNDKRRDNGDIQPSTHTRYAEDADRHLKKFGSIDIRKISSRQITDFLEGQVSLENLSSKGFRNLKTIILGTFKYARNEGYTNVRVEEAIQDVDIPRNKFRKTKKKDCEEVFFQDELVSLTKHLMQRLDDPRALALLLTIGTGLRPGEVTTLKRSDFTYDTDEDGNKYLLIDIQRSATKFKDENGKTIYGITHTKTEAGERQVIVPTEYIFIYDTAINLNPDGDFLFLWNGEIIKVKALRDYIRSICGILGINKRSTNKVRKTYATILLDNRIDNKLITNQMGHTDTGITEKNYHRNRKTYTAISDILSDIPDFKSAFG